MGKTKEVTKATFDGEAVQASIETHEMGLHAYETGKKNWIVFGKILYRIFERQYFQWVKKESGDYCVSFKDYLSEFYPDCDPGFASKLITVCGAFGDQLDRIEKAERRVPGINSCYALVKAKEKISKAQFENLKTTLFSGAESFEKKLKEVVKPSERTEKRTTKSPTATTKKPQYQPIIELILGDCKTAVTDATMALQALDDGEEVSEDFVLLYEAVQQAIDFLDAYATTYEKLTEGN